MAATATTYFLGAPKPADIATLIPTTYQGISIQRGVNQTPLWSRFRKVPIDSPMLQRFVGSGRPNSTTLTEAVADTTGTELTLANVGFLMRGDVLRLNSGEFVQLTDHPDATDNTVTVRRGVAGTTAATQTDNSTVTLIGNARAGDEEFQPTYQQVPGYLVQYAQTFMFPYKVASGVQWVRPRYVTGDVLEGERGSKEADLRNDLEKCALYGLPEGYDTDVDSLKMAGLFSLIQTNNVTNPANAGAFKPSDLNAYLALLDGKDANMALVSPGFFSQLNIWGMAAMRINAGTNVFGTPIASYQAAGMPEFTFVKIPTMSGISAIFGRAEDVYWGVLQPVNDVPHGINGMARGGHWEFAGCIDIVDERNFLAIRNITAFAPQT